MAAGVANCLVCGEPLAYFEEAQEVTCHLCGKKEAGHSICVDGHYVCDACHRAGGVDWIMEYCAQTNSKDPIAIAQHLMDDKAIYPNGPEHHTLIGAALMAAYKNAGGDIDLDKALAELRKRSLQVPGGTCGFWGTCGAATSAGQFWSTDERAKGSCQRGEHGVLARLLLLSCFPAACSGESCAEPVICPGAW